LDATSTVLISFLIVFYIAFVSLASFAFCRLLLCREKTREGRSSKGSSVRPRLSSPIYSISSDSGGGKKTQSFYGAPSPIPDQREYLDVSTVREPRESRRRDRLSPPRDRSVSKGRISVLHEYSRIQTLIHPSLQL
ncbi:hypothetical protein PFISCL1PPCAC_22785, partial [Pristionchus fissidentatus]